MSPKIEFHAHLTDPRIWFVDLVPSWNNVNPIALYEVRDVLWMICV